MEPRPIRVRETTHVLRIGSLRVRRHRGRVVEFEDAPNRDGSRVERESNGRRPSKQKAEDGGSRGVNLPLLLAAHLGRNGLKMPSHVGSYDRKGDPDNYLHIFEGAIRDSLFSRTETLNFVIVRSNSPYNLLLGRIAMQKMGIVVSTIHEAIKFHTPRGIGTVFSTYEPDKVGKGPKKLREASSKQLPTNFKEKLQDLLRSNVDVFAWTHADMTRIPRTIMVGEKPFNKEHKLNEYKHVKPVKKKKHELGYHQIQMVEEDEDNMAIFMGEGIFCYQKMSFDFKNAGATYQRLVDKAVYHVSLSDLESKLASLEAEKVKLEAVEASLRQELENAKVDRAEVVSKVMPYVDTELVCDDMGRPSYKEEHTKAGNKFVTDLFPYLFDVVVDHHAFIEALLSKKP
nr:hypothetical protein [Tanacetum cinerariifolium]